MDDVLQIRWKFDADDSGSLYRLLTKVQLVRPGGGVDLDSYQVHASCILQDTKTGYRSQFLPVSGIVSLYGLEAFFQEFSEREMRDAVFITLGQEWRGTDDIFGMIVLDFLQWAELPFPC